MFDNSPPVIEPISVRQYQFKQPSYDKANKLPFRSIVVSLSQGGIGILIQILVLKLLRKNMHRLTDSHD